MRKLRCQQSSRILGSDRDTLPRRLRSLLRHKLTRLRARFGKVHIRNSFLYAIAVRNCCRRQLRMLSRDAFSRREIQRLRIAQIGTKSATVAATPSSFHSVRGYDTRLNRGTLVRIHGHSVRNIDTRWSCGIHLLVLRGRQIDVHRSYRGRRWFRLNLSSHLFLLRLRNLRVLASGGRLVSLTSSWGSSSRGTTGSDKRRISPRRCALHLWRTSLRFFLLHAARGSPTNIHRRRAPQ